MSNVLSPIERWFVNLSNLQRCMKNLNHLTSDGLKEFSKQTLEALVTTDIKGHLGVCCQGNGIGLVPDGVFDDMSENFVFFLETVGVIPIVTSLRFRIFDIAIKHNHELTQNTVAEVMKMSLDEVFGADPLNSNQGKKELDLVLNQTTPDDFYPVDGSFLTDGKVKLTAVVKRIIS